MPRSNWYWLGEKQQKRAETQSEYIHSCIPCQSPRLFIYIYQDTNLSEPPLLH
jgi:hypothetical protein